MFDRLIKPYAIASPLHESIRQARRTNAAVCSLKTVLMEITLDKSEARPLTSDVDQGRRK